MSYKRKIVVIADDFTGAAEIGGIGLRNGLKVAIETKPVKNTDNDIIVIATDTRSMEKGAAANHITDLTKELLDYNPKFIYKKIDSVLRGNVAEELIAQMQVMGKKRTIIIAANPVFERIIRDGKYYINNVPLDETCFSSDLQYPIKTNEVLKLVKSVDNYPVVSLKPDEPLPEKGLIIGDVENLNDLQKWALKYDEDTMFAGAFGFFNALLESWNLTKENLPIPIAPFKSPTLFIHGSLYPKEGSILKEMIEQGHHLSNMPMEIYYNMDFDPVLLENWTKEAIEILSKKQKLIISCNYTDSTESNISFRIKKIIAQLVKKVIEEVAVHEILIEGGSTTSEILEQLDVKKLVPIQELEIGVIRMKVEGINELYLTTKPGSYQWPTRVWVKEDISENNKRSLTNIEIHD